MGRAHRVVVLSCGVIASLLALVPSFPANPAEALPAEEQSVVASEPLSAAEAERVDNRLLAELLNVSVQDVERQTALQNIMDTIDFRKLDPGYAEDGSVMGRDFQLWYRSSQPMPEALREELARTGTLPYLEHVLVPLNERSLIKLSAAVNVALEWKKLPTAASPDSLLGGVKLHPVLGLTEQQRLGIEDEVRAHTDRWNWIAEPDVPAVGGGEYLRINNPSTAGFCTGGFTVRPESGGGDWSMSTAGHCLTPAPTSFTYYGISGLNIESAVDTKFADVGTIDGPQNAPSWQATFNDGSGLRAVNTVATRDSMDVGDSVHKYGKQTQHTVGTIADKTWCGPSGCPIGFQYVFWVKVCPYSAYPHMVVKGDSGGPFFAGTKAFGVTSGVSGGGCGSFYPAEYFPQAIDAVVLTQ